MNIETDLLELGRTYSIACIEVFRFTSLSNDSHYIVSRLILIHAHPYPLLQEGRGDVRIKSEDILI